jgi:protein-tyrosine phosphatase
MRQIGNYPLWIGTAREARDNKAVLAEGIHAVVDLAAEEPAAAPVRDLIYLRFPIVDGNGNDEKLLRSMMSAVTALIRERVPTLIACRLGLSRSPSVAAVAFSKVYGMTHEEVMHMLSGTSDVSGTLMRELQRLSA